LFFTLFLFIQSSFYFFYRFLTADHADEYGSLPLMDVNERKKQGQIVVREWLRNETFPPVVDWRDAKRG